MQDFIVKVPQRVLKMTIEKSRPGVRVVTVELTDEQRAALTADDSNKARQTAQEHRVRQTRNVETIIGSR